MNDGELYVYQMVAEVARRFCASDEDVADFLQYQVETLDAMLAREEIPSGRMDLLREFMEAISVETLQRTSSGNFCGTLG